jgi:nucleoside permease NupC
LLGAIITGVRQSTTIIVQFVAFVLAFVIIMAFLNSTSVWFGERIGVENMTLEVILANVKDSHGSKSCLHNITKFL